jgi:hypothetical protein
VAGRTFKTNGCVHERERDTDVAAALNLNSGTYSVAAARYGAVVGLDPVCRVRRYGALNRRTVLPYTAGRRCWR